MVRKAWGRMDVTSRQRRLFLHALQTYCGNEGGERLVGLGVRVEKDGEEVRR
jgi:hypothetical protein